MGFTWVEQAIRVELEREREDRLAAAERYFAELASEVGEPTPEEWADAEAWVDRVVGRAEERQPSSTNASGVRHGHAYTRRMPRMQIYLPEDLYQEVKARELPVSEMLQRSIRRELEAEEKRDGIRRYVEELIAELGEPTPEEMAEAKAWVDRIMGETDDQRRAHAERKAS